MDLSIDHPCMTCVLRVYRDLCSTRVACGAAAIIAALDLARAVILASDVGKVQLGGRRATAVGLRVWQGDKSSEIGLDGASSGVIRDNRRHPMWFLSWQDVQRSCQRLIDLDHGSDTMMDDAS